jgi:hypothetical protein
MKRIKYPRRKYRACTNSSIEDYIEDVGFELQEYHDIAKELSKLTSLAIADLVDCTNELEAREELQPANN